MICVCVIAEEKGFSTLLTDLLEPDFEVSTGWGDDAYRVLTETKCDLVLLDLAWSYPERGWNILTFMRLHPRLSKIPVLLCMPPSDEVLAKEDWLNERGIYILEKPFELDTLEAAIASTAGPSVSAR